MGLLNVTAVTFLIIFNFVILHLNEIYSDIAWYVVQINYAHISTEKKYAEFTSRNGFKLHIVSASIINIPISVLEFKRCVLNTERFNHI